MTARSVHASTEHLLASARTPDVCPNTINRAKAAQNYSAINSSAISFSLPKLTRLTLQPSAAPQPTTSELFRTIEYP